MNFDDFIKKFQQWRKKNDYPKREDCRDFFRKYRDYDGTTDPIDSCDWCDYILIQDKPAMFLDNLFKKDGVVSKLEQEEKENSDTEKEDILAECYNYIQANNILPNFSDISNSNAKKLFESEENLFIELQNKYQDLSTYILNEKSFDKDYNKNVIKEIKKYNKFVITTAVSNKRVDKNFLNSLKNYCEYNQALLLILPCEDVANRKSIVKYQLDPELKDFPIIYNDTFINNNLMISDIKVSAKTIHPLSGLSHLCHDKSVIVASTKQELEFAPNFVGIQPHCIMTTGSITVGNYDTDMFMSKRTSKLATYDHIVGAIIIELEDKNIFHFRQIQADKLGRIFDLDTIYNPDKTRDIAEDICAVLGDLHTGEEERGVLQTELEVIQDLDIKKVVLHDCSSMRSIAHWDKSKTVTQAIKSKEGKLSLEEEANQTAYNLLNFKDLDEVYIVRSNHDKFLHRWIEAGDYAKDPINLYYALDIVKAFIEGKDPFVYMLKEKTVLKTLKGKRNKYKFLEKNENKQINGVEISLHSDKGINGAKGSDKSIYKGIKSCVIAHTHSPKIFRGIYTVGTSTRKDLPYIDGGLSTWGHSMCLIHSNGTKQLINIIKANNQYRWRSY